MPPEMVRIPFEGKEVVGLGGIRLYATATAPHWRSLYLNRIGSAHLRVALMSILSSGLGLVFVLAALCLSGRTAHAQAGPMTYWIPNLPVGFGGNLTVGQSSNTYGNFP